VGQVWNIRFSADLGVKFAEMSHAITVLDAPGLKALAVPQVSTIDFTPHINIVNISNLKR